MRNHRDRDKRRLYLLSEGVIQSNTALWEQLPPSERALREASVKQRKQLIQSNPSLHLSLTRLSIRNVPRNVDSKMLKQLARQAVVGFAKDAKEGRRQRLSKEELARGGEEMKKAEDERRGKAKGVVKQAKIVFEGREGGKVTEESGAGRSRGYGFIEYYTHRSALMGLRWLNGHLVDGKMDGKSKTTRDEGVQERKKRLIVEFAIENAQVVNRRKEREEKARQRGKGRGGDIAEEDADGIGRAKVDKKKRRRGSEADEQGDSEPAAANKKDDKIAKRERIIQKKRMMRRAKKRAA